MQLKSQLWAENSVEGMKSVKSIHRLMADFKPAGFSSTYSNTCNTHENRVTHEREDRLYVQLKTV